MRSSATAPPSAYSRSIDVLLSEAVAGVGIGKAQRDEDHADADHEDVHIKAPDEDCRCLGRHEATSKVGWNCPPDSKRCLVSATYMNRVCIKVRERRGRKDIKIL